MSNRFELLRSLEQFTVYALSPWQYKHSEITRLHRQTAASVVRVPGYRSRGAGSIPGDIRFSEKKWVWNGVHLTSRVQLRSYLEEKVAASV
jgi:hypothetical protein